MFKFLLTKTAFTLEITVTVHRNAADQPMILDSAVSLKLEVDQKSFRIKIFFGAHYK